MKSQLHLKRLLEKQITKNEIELNAEKDNLIKSIKNLKKDDVLPKMVIPKKLTLWEKIKRVLMGL